VTARVPVVLEIRFKNLVAVVILDSLVLLAKAVDISCQQVGKRIAGSSRVLGGGIEGQVTGNRARSQFIAQFVHLRSHEISPELEIVFAYDSGDVVAVGIGRVRVVEAVRNVTGIFPEIAAVSRTR